MHPKGRVLSTIKYVIVVIQENRTLNNLFNGFPGAVTTPYGPDGHTALATQPIASACDPKHRYQDFRLEAHYNGSVFLNDQWNLAPSTCQGGVEGPPGYGLAIVPSIPRVYSDLATQYALADNTYQMNMGPSFAAHQYLIAGQTGGYSGSQVGQYGESGNPGLNSNHKGNLHTSGGCDVTQGIAAGDMNMLLSYPNAAPDPNVTFPPCQDYQTIFDVIVNGGLNPQPTWRFFTPYQTLIWSAPIGVSHLYKGGGYDPKNIDASTSEAQHFYDAVQNVSSSNPFPNLTYIVPCPNWSDHPVVTNANPPNGPNWVGFIAQTIGVRPEIWNHAVIIVVWDDWGGWYDPAVPPYRTLAPPPVVSGTTIANPDPIPGNSGLDPYEYGYRVPMLVISPFLNTTPGQVDHTARTTASILDFIEYTFIGPGSEGVLRTLDNIAGHDDLVTGPNALINPNKSPLLPPPNLTVSGFPANNLPTCPTDDTPLEEVDY